MERRKRKIICIIAFLCISALIVGTVAYTITNQRAQIKKQEVLEACTREGVLIYGADKSAPPLRFIDEDGVYKGVVVDYMNQLSLELGVEIRLIPYQWEEAQEALKKDETDLADMLISKERAKYYAFTEPIYNLRTVLAVRVDEKKYTFSDIKNMTVAAQKGDYAIEYLKNVYPEAKVALVENVAEGLERLTKGEVDAVIGDEPVVYYYIRKQQGDSQFKMINTALYEKPVVLAVSKENERLVPIINEAIKNINEKGLLEKIQQKWFGISTPLVENSTNLMWLKVLIGAVVITIVWIILIALNNRRLKKLVGKRTRELENGRNELQIIFDGIPEFIAVLSEQKEIAKANSGLLNALNVKVDSYQKRKCIEIIGKFCGDCEQCIVDASGILNKEVKREVMYGSQIYEMIAYPLEKAGEGTLVMLRNVTLDTIKRKQLLQSGKMIAIGQLAAGMAHEIRNPMGIIRTQSFLLHQGNGLDEEAKKSLEFIDESVQRASKIIDNVMNFWRDGEEVEEKINLYENIRNILILQNDYIQKKKIQVTVECDKNIEICGSGEALKHILINLTTNAVDAILENGFLKIRGHMGEEMVVLECEDSGGGIEKQYLDDIFNPFFTTKEPGKGTGLGLFIVYAEVEKLAGTIEVRSTVGVGTTFIIKLPIHGKELSE